MKLIVGLGNPGNEYKDTRHNVGFNVLDAYVNDIWKEKFDALYVEKIIDGEKVLFIKPMTYMNLSGTSLVKFVNFYKINPKSILIVHDDLDLPSGKVRIKASSSSGGHNGIKNIIECLGTKEFLQLKVGIGNNKNESTRNYVLDKLSKEELKFLSDIVFENIFNDFINNADVNTLMNKYN